MDLEDFRQKVRDSFAEHIGQDKARKLERACYNWALEEAARRSISQYWENVEFRRVYQDKARSIRFNLKNPANPSFLKKVQDGEVNLKLMPWMKPWEIFPDLWVEAFEEVARLQLNREAAEVKLPDDYQSQAQCRKCKAYKVTWVEMQTRSADEPATIWWNCHSCSNRWRT